MADDLEVIRDKMDQTRSSLSDKLEALEGQVRETVEGATQAVNSTVETVQDTVESVKDAFDLAGKVERNPWLAFGSAVAVGYVGGWLLGPSSPPREREAAPLPRTNGYHETPPAANTSAMASSSNGVGSAFTEGFGMLKGLALGTLMGVVRELATSVVPDSLRQETVKMMDQFTTSLGGKPIAGSLGLLEEQPKPEGDEDHGERNKAEVGRPMGPARRQDQDLVGRFDR